MPTLECLQEKVTKLEIAQAKQSEEMKALRVDMKLNTKATLDTNKGVQEIVELLKWWKTSRKLVIGLGSFLGGLWAIVEAIKHFKWGG